MAGANSSQVEAFEAIVGCDIHDERLLSRHGLCFSGEDASVAMLSPVDALRARHDGASIAVLGSSPSLSLYRSEQDVTIGVNGAAIAIGANCRMDYFMCGDKNSPNRRWFLASERFGATRLVASHVLPFDPIVIPNVRERQGLQQELRTFVAKGNHAWQFALGAYEIKTRHGFFEYRQPSSKQRVSRRQRKFVKGGTISGTAVQMALLMGASSIHLYGCSFGAVGGSHYAYDPEGEPGQIQRDQTEEMDFILRQILQAGVRVFSHGPTALRMSERAD